VRDLGRTRCADGVAREVVDDMAIHIDAIQPATDDGNENDEKDREKGGKAIGPEASIQ
jgi:hypothetical protein